MKADRRAMPLARRRLTRGWTRLIQERLPGANGLRLLDLLFERPLIQVNLVKDSLGIAFVTANKLVQQIANKLVQQMESLELLQEITARRRDRVFSYTPYVSLFQDEPLGAEGGELQETEADGRPSQG